MQTYVISLLVENQPGVLARIAGMFTRRNMNIASLNVSPCEQKGRSRMTLTFKGDDRSLETTLKQLNRLVEVVKVRNLTPEKTIYRDLCLFKVNVPDASTREEVIKLAETAGGRIAGVGTDHLILERVGNPTKIEHFISLFSDFEIEELVRSGVIALSFGNRIEKKEV
jgi:acetolactate synthase-1/3 small subunit